MRQLRIHQHQPWNLPTLRQANLIWLRRMLAAILIIVAIVLIAAATLTTLAVCVGWQLHYDGMP